MTTQQMAISTTQQVADRMKELFNENQFDKVQDELYDSNCISIEPKNHFGLDRVEGLTAIKEKGKQFNALIEEMHGGYVSDFNVAGNFISCAMGMDITMKGLGRIKMDEIAVYEVRDGKIVLEQFFF